MTQYGAAAGAGDPAPVCPRHPDRVSYVRCQNCGRPVCPECQRPADVGVWCVDCVAEVARHRPRWLTIFGAELTERKPVVTYTLIGLCVAVYVLQILPGSTVTQTLFYWPAVTAFEPWRMITASFLHSPNAFFHILANMWALWVLGQALEPILGRVRFLALYLLSALGGSVSVLVLADPAGLSWRTPVLGASGAIFGLFGVLLVVQRVTRGPLTQIVALLAINAAIGFVVPGISWEAHLGGFVTGLAGALLLVRAPARHRGPVQAVALSALFAVLVVVSAVQV